MRHVTTKRTGSTRGMCY
ncbi:hypothetical protein Golob_013958 [Gossypium lobatum]|uniref:Uncharacterized protein n=1 Tax=Gossypium lobatum TaxID=34289 RepID=A0A7J8LR64_9ROSI|nr:hypothetical protein [Gossypium lobatum]